MGFLGDYGLLLEVPLALRGSSDNGSLTHWQILFTPTYPTSTVQ